MSDSKKTTNHNTDTLITSMRVGFFLALRQIRHTNMWTSALIVFIMMLTFMNLIIVSGVLVGLIEGAVRGIEDRYTGAVILSNLKDKSYIEHSSDVVKNLESVPGIQAFTARYLESGTIESNYKTKTRATDTGEIVGTLFAGINPNDEEAVTHISELVIEGSYFDGNDFDEILVGALLLKKYLDFESPNFPILGDFAVGDKVRIVINGNTREVIVKGILKSKVDEIDRRVFFVDSQLRGLIGRYDYNVDEIAIKIEPKTDPIVIKEMLIARGLDAYARVQTREDAEPKFLKDIKQTFALLGNIISSIGVVVAVITVFIVIFINAITRRKFIGILKAIGIEARAIEFAYVLQSLFYAITGTALGCAFIFGFLKPYIDAHPIQFPFSEGIL